MIRFTENFVVMCHVAHCPLLTADIRSITFHDGTGYVGLYDIQGPFGLSFLVEHVRNPAEYENHLRTLYNANHN